MKKIALIGEYNPDSPSHQATLASLDHANQMLGSSVQGEWVSTNMIEAALFQEYAAVWIAPGSPYKNLDKTLWTIQYAREHNVPCLGTCGGFQHIILEYARHVLGVDDAEHAEYHPSASNLFISRLACSLFGKEMTIHLQEGSKVAALYGCTEIVERYYCNFGVNPDYVPLFRRGSMEIVGSDSEGEVRVVEIPTHPFFIGTLFVPQNQSTVEKPHPLIVGFVRVIHSKEV